HDTGSARRDQRRPPRPPASREGPPTPRSRGCDAGADEQTYDQAPSGPFLARRHEHHRVSRGPDPQPGILTRQRLPTSPRSLDFIGAYSNNHFECVRLETERIRTGFCDEATDDLIEAARQAGSEEERIEAVEAAVRALTEVHMPWVPLFVRAETWAMQPYVNGF